MKHLVVLVQKLSSKFSWLIVKRFAEYYPISIAKLSSSSSPVELSTALILIISTHPHPPTPGIVVMRHF